MEQVAHFNDKTIQLEENVCPYDKDIFMHKRLTKLQRKSQLNLHI